MKEKWKVFIRGNKDRGEEVIKVLTDLGGRGDALNGLNKDCIYFIDHDGVIDFAYLVSETAQIIMDNYTELHLPEKWKDGDILFSEEHKEFAVFADEWESSPAKFLSYFAISNGRYLTYKTLCKKDFRLATKSEVAQFYESLRSVGKEWDAKKKQFVDWKWKPKPDEDYYFITSTGKVLKSGLYSCGIDTFEILDFGNCFRTRKEAEAMAEKVKKLLKGEQL